DGSANNDQYGTSSWNLTSQPLGTYYIDIFAEDNKGNNIYANNIGNFTIALKPDGMACGDGSECESGGCCNSVCGSGLTWSGSTHCESDCTSPPINGTVFNTGGSGTICKISGSELTVPSGWSQASNWQRYSYCAWGGDMCGRWQSIISATNFINSSCSYESWKRASMLPKFGRTCAGCTNDWCSSIMGDPALQQRYYADEQYLGSSSCGSTCRIELGIY
ncbi:hypothetical protein HOD96_01110, partial [Candidatus Falkowbacteria bacterium]|nr:hypothetical protein [Candidatus Falkowbacteria bacterium]